MKRLSGLAEMLPQQQTLVTTWVVVHGSQRLKAELRIKGWSLESECGKEDLLTATSASLLFRCAEQSRPQTLVTPRFLYPELPNLAATTPGAAADPGDDSFPLVSHEDR
jgi:hypothetical protein